jgi:hypothetical protein
MELLFKVVEVVPSGDRMIAAADNLAVARVAFDTAVALRPQAAIELRQKARVIVNSRGWISKRAPRKRGALLRQNSHHDTWAAFVHRFRS